MLRHRFQGVTQYELTYIVEERHNGAAIVLTGQGVAGRPRPVIADGFRARVTVAAVGHGEDHAVCRHRAHGGGVEQFTRHPVQHIAGLNEPVRGASAIRECVAGHEHGRGGCPHENDHDAHAEHQLCQGESGRVVLSCSRHCQWVAGSRPGARESALLKTPSGKGVSYRSRTSKWSVSASTSNPFLRVPAWMAILPPV